MFRALLRQNLTNKCSTGAVSQFKRFESNLQTRRPKEIRDVKLIGTIYQGPLKLQDGCKVLMIKTVQSDDYYKVHRAIVRKPQLLNLIGDNLTVGQRIFVAGELRVTNFVNNENRNRQSLHVNVNEIYASKLSDGTNASEIENSDSRKFIDYNNVTILGHIASDVQHFDNFSQFFVATHHKAKDPISGGETDKVSFIPVFVHENYLIQMFQNNLQKRDRVFIHGFLNSKSEIDQNGQKKYGGYIEATNILRADRFAEYNNESVLDESVNE